MLIFACRFHPLVCEYPGRREAGSGCGVVRLAESDLIESLKNLSQLFGKSELCLEYLVSSRGSAAERASGLRAAGCGCVAVNPVGVSAPRRREPPQSHHASACSQSASRPDSARRPAGHACSRHTVQAICIAQAKKHSRDARAIRYARTYLALGASGVLPIDGAADASAG